MGKTEAIKSEIAALAQDLKIYQPLTYPPLRAPGKKLDQLNLLIKLDPENWPIGTLVQKLKSLPPRFVISVDPFHIL